MLTKEKVISSIQDMPYPFSMNDLLQKIEAGLEQFKKGEVFSEEKAQEMLKQWSK